MKGSEIFVKTLEDLKLERIFGNPGSTEMSMLRHVKNYILTLHDGIALGMADGLSMVSGSPQVCNLHTTLGLGNSIAYLQTAFENRSPVVLTTGQQDYRHIFREPLLSGDIVHMAEKYTKYTYEIKNVGDIELSLKKAFAIARQWPQGPVLVSFPSNFMDEDCNYIGAEISSELVDSIDTGAADSIIHAINESSNPAVVFGFEIDALNAHNFAVKFAERLGCPVFAEPLSSRAPFPSENSVFSSDLVPASALFNTILSPFDLIVIIGGDLKLYPYTPAPILPGKSVICVSLTGSVQSGKYYRMNPKEFLKYASSRVRKKGSFKSKIDPLDKTKAVLDRKYMGPSHLFSKVSKTFNDHVIVDESISLSLELRRLLGYRPGSYFSARSGQLGWGLPAAAGISLEKDKVLCVIGDGSLMYAPQTLWSISHYKLPVKLLVLDNGGYMILRSYALSYYPDMKDQDFLRPQIELEKIANAFNIEHKKAGKELSELEWLRAGSDPKMLVVSTGYSIPRLFM